MATREELIKNIREKYPQYSDIGDDDLASRISKKYPVYAKELAGPSIGQIELEAGLLGGTGVPITDPIEREAKARERFVKRSQLEGLNNIQMMDGKVVDVNQLSTLGKVLLSIPRAFSSGQTLGLTDVAEKGLENALLATGLTTPEAVNALGVGAQKRQEGGAEVLSGLAGGLATGAPTARAVGQSPSLLRKVVSGGSTGAQAGAISELNRQISEGEEIDPGSIGKTSLIGAAIGGGIPLGSQALVTGGKLVGKTARGLSRVSPVEAMDVKFGDYTVDVLKPTTPVAKEAVQNQLKSGEIQDNIRELSKYGKLDGTVSGLENGRKAVDVVSERITQFDESNPDIINNTDDVADQLRSLANSKELTDDDVKARIVSFANKIGGDRTLRKSRDLLNELNDARRAYFKKSASGKETDLDNAMHEAEQIARDAISTKLDNIYRATTGDTANPYRQYGSLNGFLDALSVRVDDLITKRGIEKSVGPSLDREVLATIKKNASLLTGGELGRIDDRFRKMVSLVDQAQPTRVRNLTQEEINDLPPVQRELPNSPEANRLTLEEQFRNLTQQAQRQRLADQIKNEELARQLMELQQAQPNQVPPLNTQSLELRRRLEELMNYQTPQ